MLDLKRGDVKTSRVIAAQSSSDMLFQALCDEFIRSAQIRGLSEWTIKSYRHHTRYFIEFAGFELKCKDVRRELIDDYILYMMDVKGLSNTVTLNSYLHNISPIIKYGIKKRVIIEDFMVPIIKGQETFKEIYTDSEMKSLLEPPKKKDFVTQRTFAIIWVFASTGIRARELRELKVQNVDMFSRTILLNVTKNKKPRVVPISTSLYEVLLKYLELRNGNAEDPLFPTVYNETMAMSTLQDSVMKYCRDRGVHKTSLHLFRHTFITRAVNQNVNPMVLKRITGHSSMAQLNRYYNARSIDLVNVIDDVAPKLAKKNSQFK